MTPTPIPASHTARLILNLSELGVHGGVGSGGEEGEGEVEGCSAECAGSPVWYSVMISVSHFFLTINRWTYTPAVRQLWVSLVLTMYS